MKIKPIHIALILFLFLGIVMFTSGSTYVPYSKDMLFSKMYKYEGMENPDSPITIPTPTDNNFPPPLPDGAPPPNMPYSPPDKPEVKKEDKKVEGFALQPSPLSDNIILNRFGDTPSGPQCFGQSSGYSNSLGPLCFSQDDKKWFASRGGNATTGESVIGGGGTGVKEGFKEGRSGYGGYGGYGSSKKR